MLTITTSKGKTYENADYAWAPLFDGSCGISIEDARPIYQIAEEFDGLESIHCVDTAAEREYNFEGYTKLVKIEITGASVQMKLIKGDS